MKRGTRLLGNGVRVLTLMVCVLTLGVSISRAQVRPPGGIGGGPPPGGKGGGAPPGGGQGHNPIKAPVVRDGAFDDPKNDLPIAEGNQAANSTVRLFLLIGGMVFGIFLLGACAFGGLMLIVLYNRSM